MAAGWVRTVGVEQPQHGHADAVPVADAVDDGGDLLPPRVRHVERRQRAERPAGGVDQDHCHGAGHGRTLTEHPYGMRAD